MEKIAKNAENGKAHFCWKLRINNEGSSANKKKCQNMSKNL